MHINLVKRNVFIRIGKRHNCKTADIVIDKLIMLFYGVIKFVILVFFGFWLDIQM